MERTTTFVHLPREGLGAPALAVLQPGELLVLSELAGKLTGRDCTAFAMSSSPVKMK